MVPENSAGCGFGSTRQSSGQWRPRTEAEEHQDRAAAAESDAKDQAERADAAERQASQTQAAEVAERAARQLAEEAVRRLRDAEQARRTLGRWTRLRAAWRGSSSRRRTA